MGFHVEMGLGISIVNEFYVNEPGKSEPKDKKLFTAVVSDFFGNAERGMLRKKGGIPSLASEAFINLLLITLKH